MEITCSVGEDGESKSPNVEETEPHGGQSKRAYRYQPPSQCLHFSTTVLRFPLSLHSLPWNDVVSSNSNFGIICKELKKTITSNLTFFRRFVVIFFVLEVLTPLLVSLKFSFSWIRIIIFFLQIKNYNFHLYIYICL